MDQLLDFQSRISPENMNECITGVVVSPNSSYCAVSISSGQLHVLNIESISSISSLGCIDGIIRGFDIHKNNEEILVSTGKTGTQLYDLKTTKTVSSLSDRCFWSVKYLYNPNRVFYIDHVGFGHIMDMDAVNLMTFDKKTFRLKNGNNFDFQFRILNNDTQLLSAHGFDKTLRLHDVGTGAVLGVFYEHCSTGFNNIAVDPLCRTVLAVNHNGALYKLQSSRNFKTK